MTTLRHYLDLMEVGSLSSKGNMLRDAAFKVLLDRAHQAGVEAARNARPRLTRVVEPCVHGDKFYDIDWASDDAALGCCGHASIRIRPANSVFANWCKRQTMAEFGSSRRPYAETDRYAGGVLISVDVQVPRSVDRTGQSYDIKMAYAIAFAKVLVAAGYDACAMGRID